MSIWEEIVRTDHRKKITRQALKYIKKLKKTRSEKQSKEFNEELINIVPEQHHFNKASQKILKDEKLKKNKQAKQKGNYRENCTSFHSEDRMWCVNESKKIIGP